MRLTRRALVRRLLPGLVACLAPGVATAQKPGPFTRADTLRGSITPERAWWDVVRYDLDVRVTPPDSSIRGSNAITYRVLGPAREMQIDLMRPLEVDSVVQDGRALRYRRDGNAFFVSPTAPQPVGETRTVTVHYHGRPRVAVNAPWDGGFVWAQDSTGAPWVATAVQGLGASAWWPNKDTQADEPESQRIAVTVPSTMVEVSNGRLAGARRNGDGTTTYEWLVTEPINNYDVAVNAGDYAHFSDRYAGEGGTLTLEYYPLRYHLEAARRQFEQVKPMLACFEHWFGPYPWYRDGYKLVETPHLGMEHQSAVAYGNHYRNGYLGRDLSHTGRGLAWDFILIHESAHEWWGNSITTRDIADMWVHEAFANYAEGLYTECQQGKAAGAEYVRGNRENIRNDRPIVGAYGVNDEGSGDMYYKGGNLLHTLRQIVGDDEKWRSILRGLNEEFRHRIVSGEEVQAYIGRRAGLDLGPVFRQYLTTTKIPVLEYRLAAGTLRYRWAEVVPGFAMPVRVTLPGGESRVLHPATTWKSIAVKPSAGAGLEVDPDYYVNVRRLGGRSTAAPGGAR